MKVIWGLEKGIEMGVEAEKYRGQKRMRVGQRWKRMRREQPGRYEDGMKGERMAREGSQNLREKTALL